MKALVSVFIWQLGRFFNKIFVQLCIVHYNWKWFVYMFLDTVLRQKMHNKWAAARQNQQNDLCAKRRLRSAWTSAQSDQSLRCPNGETLGPLLQRRSWSDRVDAQADLSLLNANVVLLVLSCGGSGYITTATTTAATTTTTTEQCLYNCDCYCGSAQMSFCLFCRAATQDACLLLLVLLLLLPLLQLLLLQHSAAISTISSGWAQMSFCWFCRAAAHNALLQLLLLLLLLLLFLLLLEQCLCNCDFYMPRNYLLFNFTAEMLPAYIVVMATLCCVGFIIPDF